MKKIVTNPCFGIIHKIKHGDTLYILSRMYQVSIDDLLRSNPGIDMYNMQPGNEVCIPVRTNITK